MKYKLIALLGHLLIIVFFFFPIFNVKSEGERIVISGWQALVHDQYFVFGNIMIWFVLLGSIYYIVYFGIGLFIQSQKLEKTTISVAIFQIIAGLVVVTLLGTYLEIAGMAMIGLIVAATLLYDRGKKEST